MRVNRGSYLKLIKTYTYLLGSESLASSGTLNQLKFQEPREYLLFALKTIPSTQQNICLQENYSFFEIIHSQKCPTHVQRYLR